MNGLLLVGTNLGAVVLGTVGASGFACTVAMVVVGMVAAIRSRRRGERAVVKPWVGYVFAVCVLALALAPLAEAWTHPRTHGAFIAGVVPYSDAGDYLQGAEGLLRRNILDAWNSRRPLNAALLAVRLKLSGGSLLGALVFQALLLAGSIGLLARALWRSPGPGAAAMVAGALLIFGGIFTPTTMSEALGLSLGALAMAALWVDGRSPSAGSLFAGVFGLSLALSARSGPVLMLPLVVLWAARGRRLKWDVKSAGVSLCAVLLGGGYSTVLTKVLHGETSGAQSNFAYTLYGLSVGGRGWQQAWVDLPGLSAVPEQIATARVYAAARANITEHPGRFALGLFRNVEALAMGWTEMLSAGALAHHRLLQWAVALALGAVLAYGVLRLGRVRRKDPCFWLFLAGCMGALASVPVIYVDGRERVFAAGFAMLVTAVAYALSPALEREPEGGNEGPRGWVLPATVMAMLVGVAPFAGKLGNTHEVRIAIRNSCGEGRQWVDVDLEGAPIGVAFGARGVATSVSLEDFRQGIAHDPNLGDNDFAQQLSAVGAGDSLFAAWDDVSGRMVYVLTRAREPLRAMACAEVIAAGARPLLRVRDSSAGVLLPPRRQ